MNLATTNLHFETDTGLGFTDLGSPIGLSYGYDRANTGDCLSGILKACGWYTNWDERITRAAYPSTDFTYQGSSGNRYLGSTDDDAQLSSGAPVQLTAPRITLYDENPVGASPTSGVVMTTAAAAGIPTYSGPSVLQTNANTSSSLGQVPYVDLNQYPMVSFAARSKQATGVGIDFKIHDKTTDTYFWFVYELGTSFTTGFDHINLGGTLLNTWNAQTRNLYNDVYTLHGGSYDSYEVVATQTTTNGLAQGSYVYIDAMRFQGRDDLSAGSYPGFFKDANPTWTQNGTLATLNTTDKAVGTASLQVASAALGSSPWCDSQSGHTCFTNWNTSAWPFASWSWKKVGGASVAIQFQFQDTRTSAVKDLTYYAGALPSGVPSTCGLNNSQPCAIRVDTQIPETWTKITRNLVADARQVLGFYNDNPTGSNPASPPSQGPTPDTVRWLSVRISGVDGQYGLFDNLTTFSAPDLGTDDPAGSTYGLTASEDFSARYADGSVHAFNAAGLLTRITDLDGNSTTLDWTLDTTKPAGSGQDAYRLDMIHAPTDGTTAGSYTYQREIDVTYLPNSPTSGFANTIFTESLGSTGTGGSTPTGRSAIFAVATGASSGSPTYGANDLVYVSPARRAGTSCSGTRPTGCTEFSYNNTTTHSVLEVRDPRWSGTTSGANDFVTGVAYTGSNPYAITDKRTGVSQLYIPTGAVANFDRGSGTYRVAVYQTAAMRATSYATDIALSPDGRPLTEYIAKPCTGGQCTTTTTTWPTAAGTGDRAAVNAFDGLSNISETTTFRTPNANPVVTRQATASGIRVDSFVDALAGGETVWTQDADQYAAWDAASRPTQSDGVTPTTPYITAYAYDANHRPVHVVREISNASGTNAIRDIHTTYDAEGHPTATDDNTFIKNPGFEDGAYGGWNTYTGTATLDSTTSHSGTRSVKGFNASTATDHYQSVNLLPGQTFRLQAWAKAASGSTASIKVLYQWKSDSSYHQIGSISTTATAWTQIAADVTIPTDGTGNIHVDLYTGANQTAWYDDVSLFTTYATRTFAANGLVTDQYTLNGASPTGTTRAHLGFAATSVHPAIYPTTAIANDIDGTPGPNPDQDVTSTTTYDRWGRTLTATDPDGVGSTTTYAANMTDVASTTDGTGATTTFTTDAVGNPLTKTSPLNETTTTTYDFLNHPLLTTAPDGTKTLAVYNAYGQATSTIANDINGVANDDASGIDDVTSTAAYDAYGHVITTSADTGHSTAIAAKTEATYDLLGNVVSTTTHTGNRLRNAGFEAATTASAWSINANWSIRSDGNPTYVHTGSNSLEAKEPASSPAVEYGQTFRLSMTGGTTYDASAYVTGYSTNASTANIYLRLRFFTADGSSTDTTAGSVTTVGATQSWVKIGGLVTAPAGTVEGFAFFGLDSTNPVANDRVYIDDVVVDELRTTTTYFDAVGHPAGSRGPAVPTGAPAPACPGAPSTYCSTVTAFDRNGRPTLATDAYGKVTRTLYDLDGKPVRVTANYVDDVYSAGSPDTDLATTTIYDLAGQVRSTIDPAGRTTTTTVDALHRITMVTRADGSFAKTVYTYGGRVDHASAIAASGTSDPNLTWTKTVYDRAGRAIKTLAHFDTTGAAGTAIASFERDDADTTIDNDGITEHWSAAAGTFISAGATQHRDGGTSTMSGAERLRVTLGTGGNTGTEWTLDGTFQGGHTYQARIWVQPGGQTVSGKLGTASSSSSVASVSGSGWQALDLTWAPLTNQTSVRLAIYRASAGSATDVLVDNAIVWDSTPNHTDWNLPSETAYDADGRVIASVIAPGVLGTTEQPMVTTTAYDSMGRVTGITVNAVTGGSTSDSVTNLATTTAYDALGRATSSTSPAGIVTRAEYDRLGRRTATIANYVNGVTSSAIGDDDVRSTFAYDALGELTGYCPAVAVDAAGCSPAASAAAATAWHYDTDAAGHAVAEIPPVNVSAVALSATYHEYDAGGRMTRMCTAADGTNAACAGTSNPRTTYAYDGVGRPTTTTVYSNASTVKLTTTTTYNADGTTASTAFDGTGSSEGTDTLSYTYDAMGRPDQTKRGSTVLTDNT